MWFTAAAVNSFSSRKYGKCINQNKIAEEIIFRSISVSKGCWVVS